MCSAWSKNGEHVDINKDTEISTVKKRNISQFSSTINFHCHGDDHQNLIFISLRTHSRKRLTKVCYSFGTYICKGQYFAPPSALGGWLRKYPKLGKNTVGEWIKETWPKYLPLYFCYRLWSDHVVPTCITYCQCHCSVAPCSASTGIRFMENSNF